VPKSVYVNVFSSIEISAVGRTPVVKLGYSRTPEQKQAGLEKHVIFSLTPDQAKAIGSLLHEAGTTLGLKEGTKN
jgi:hypothetical protein